MSGKGKVPCSTIHEALDAYVMGELSGKREWLVREHLKSCPECAGEARRIRRTLDALNAMPPINAPVALTPKARRRLKLAILHPLLDWIYCHHRLVAWTVAFLTASAILLIAYLCRIKPEFVIYWL